jgi:chromosomal replication initiation ATPase DnaA
MMTILAAPAFRPYVPLVREQAWRVQTAVEHATGVAHRDLCAPTRKRPRAARARQIAMYLCHTVYGMSLSQVALTFGRHRATVKYAFLRIEEQRDDPDLDRTLCWLETMLTRDGRPS